MRNALQHFSKNLTAFVTITLIAVFATNALVIAEEFTHTGGNIQIVASIRPSRILVVDENFVIQKIYSNTATDVRPVVYLNSLDGEELPYSETITKEYLKLKPGLDLSSPGMVYERESRPVVAFFKSIGTFFVKIFSIF